MKKAIAVAVVAVVLCAASADVVQNCKRSCTRIQGRSELVEQLDRACAAFEGRLPRPRVYNECRK